jgi:hypothetical protein
MPYAADDLTPLLFPPVRSDIGFHQGKVVAWNPATAENTISMAGATLTDVPILNGTEVPLLAVGHTVSMLRWKSSYFILGRIIIPNTPDIGALPGGLAGVGSTTTNFAISTSGTVVTSGTLTVPPWANQALVMCVANISVLNNSGSTAFCYLAATISGGWGGEMYSSITNGLTGHVSAATQYLLGEGAPDGLGDFITIAAQVRGSTSWTATSGNIASVHAIATFRKV